MCIAIAQPKGSTSLTIDELERGWVTNPDGGGYAYIDENNEIQAVFSMDMDTFILQYIESFATYGASSPFMVHMRIATHGSVSIANCHPFTIQLDGDGEMMFMHNGIIDNVEKDIEGSDLTDTEGLAVYVLNDMHDGWLDNPHLVDFIETFIDYSKLVFLTTSPELDKNLYILNDSNGVWSEDGIWYSNYSCFTYKKASTKRNLHTGLYGWGYGDDDDYATSGKAYYNRGERKGYYKNGKYHEGTDASFGDWLRDDSERRYDGEELRNATHDDHVDMLNESIIRGDMCPVCTGIVSCLCDDVCGVCYEYYHACECDGEFISLTKSFGKQWGDRVTAIANGSDVEDYVDDEPCDMCGTNNCPDADQAHDPFEIF